MTDRGQRATPPLGPSRHAMKTLIRILSRICIAVLLLVVVSFALLILLPELGICPQLDMNGITCSGGVSQALAELALSVFLVSVFSGIPLLLALIGVVILVVRLFRKWRGA